MCVWIKWTHRRKRLKCECPYICRQDSELRKRVYNVAQWKPFWLKDPLNYMRTDCPGQCILPLQALIYKTHLWFQEWAFFSTAKKQQIPSRSKKWHQKTNFFLLILFHRNTHGGNVPWIFKWFIHHFWMKQNAKTGMESRRSRRWHISLLKWRVEWNIVV